MSFDLDLHATTADILRAVEAFRLLCLTAGFSESRSHDVALALDEVLANIFRHGYQRDPRGQIRVHAEIVKNELRLEVRDTAPAFDPLAAPPPDFSRPIDERPVGGLGIHLVRQLADRAEYQRDGDENRLLLRWSLQGYKG